MKNFFLLSIFGLLFFLSPQFSITVNGQQAKQQPVPTDAYLLSLVNKYLQTPLLKTIRPGGEVYLQRDMSSYLRSSVFSGRTPDASELDHGHDHKDAMLGEFLNRPHPSTSTLEGYFEKAALEFNVPVGILKAAGQVQSNWAQVSESMYGSWGVMGVVENQFVKQISKAALLLNKSTDHIKNDAQTNIRAAAALLAFYQSGRPAAVNLQDWFASVKDLTGLKGEDMKSSLAERIFDLIESGSKSVSLWGEIINIDPVSVSLSKSNRMEESISSLQNSTTAVDYPNAVPNFTTCNFNNRPVASNINFYFIHYVATGTYQGAIDWFKNCTSQVSAHYVVRNFDGEVSQVVAEANRAWSQGVTAYNDQGIGVEHEVLATNLAMWDSDPMLTAAANLCVNVCNRWAISKTRRVTNGDRAIYGHSDVKATDCPNLTTARWNSFIARLTSVNAATPTLFSIENPGASDIVKATWKANMEPTLAGYRLYYATNDALTSWALAADETTLGPTSTSVTLNPAQFLVPPTGNVYHFKLTAVVANGANPLVVSNAGDIYSRSSNTAGPKVLIVDGFDRFGSGSYSNSTHSFSTSYFKALRNKGDLQISSVANEKVEDGTVVLTNYDIVVWYVGDESSLNVVLSTAEKNAVKAFLDNGGKLLFTGSEVAYNIGRTGAGAIDLPFFNNYLKATYVGDGVNTYTPATGIAASGFEGMNIPFGLVYLEDFPDAISPTNGSISILNYNISPNKGGVAYKGLFGTGVMPGAVIFLSFALETAVDSSMAAFMGKALPYFDVPVIGRPFAMEDAAVAVTATAKRINVLANDLNNGVPFDQSSLIFTQNPGNGSVTYDNLGNVTYISSPGFVGSDQFQYSIQNSNGQTSNMAFVYLTVIADQPCNPLKPEVEDAYPKRDLRGAWITSVFNIDWPSQRTLSTAQQQAQLLRMLDSLSNAGINAVYLQVRPESDALYQSSIDPWSYWLTNAQGTAPSPLWDPLSFAVEQAHKRGMELHAWLNPYRAKQSTPVLAPNHVAVLHPDWTFVVGTATLLNPGLPEVRAYLTSVIGDIARRYDVDGIHFDDYFYPSGMTVQHDSVTRSMNNPNNLTLADWRRSNVNQLIAKVYDTIGIINNEANRNVLFGVSPFGIWKVQNPTGISGQSSFFDLYCDPIAWMQAGKVDYLAPQLYWKISGPQDYISLSKWWNGQGAIYERPIYIGMGLHKLSGATGWPVSELTNQVNVNRSTTHDQVKGQILYSSKYLVGDSLGIKTTLQNGQFKYKAIPPVLAYKDAICPNAPVNIRLDTDTLRWDIPAAAADGDLPRRYVVYKFENMAEASSNKNDPKNIYAILYDNKLFLPMAQVMNKYFTVNSLDKNNNESEGSSSIVWPITGLELKVTLSGNISSINWTTLTEVNTRYFDVERSTDGINFYFLSKVTAAGNSTTGRSYLQQDLLLAAGTYYYRIKAVYLDGRVSYSVIKTVVFRNDENQLLVGPNPFSSRINIGNLVNFEKVELFDVTGRQLLSKRLRNEPTLQLDIPAVPAGVYFLRLTKTNGEQVSIKLVKQ